MSEDDEMPDRILAREFDQGDAIMMGSWGKVSMNNSHTSYTRTDLYTEALERVSELEGAGDKMHKEIIAMAIGPVGVAASAKKAADAWKALKGDTE